MHDGAARSAVAIADSVISDWAPATLVDVGCGTGAMLSEFAKRGVRVHGLEYADAGLAACRERGLSVTKLDIANSNEAKIGAFECALSMEVAEHIEEKDADRYVDLLCALSPRIVLTAAPPGQQGTDHVNEQPQFYWIKKFNGRGYRHNADLTSKWAKDWEADGRVTLWYFRNLMAFERDMIR
jgi:SAM-dependent methyltransferase